MPNYQKAKIYKLVSPSKNLVYIGSTTQPLSQRLAEHLCNYKKDKGLNSQVVLECEDYKIELLEDFPCNNRQQLEKKEGEYIKNNECINNRIAGRTGKEWYYDNQEHKKQYYESNKEKLKEYQKQYYQNNKLNEQIK